MLLLYLCTYGDCYRQTGRRADAQMDWHSGGQRRITGACVRTYVAQARREQWVEVLAVDVVLTNPPSKRIKLLS